MASILKVCSQQQLYPQTIHTLSLITTDDYDGKRKLLRDKRYVKYANRLFGAVRIRQLRVSNTSCTRVVPFTPNNPYIDPACYSEYSDAKKDTTPFGPNGMYKYQTCEDLGGGTTYNGRRLSYECGGYPIFISLSASQSFGETKPVVDSLRVC